MELRFCPLFSGSSGNALYVGCDTTRILVDAGLSGTKICAEMGRFGLNPAELNGILVTHEHADHISGVGILSRRYRLPVYANEGTWQAMRDKLGSIDEANVRVFETGVDFNIGPLNVTPFATPHDAAEPVGFAICAGADRLAIATDIGAVRESWLRHLEGADVVLLESNHDVDMLKAGRYPYDLKRRILGAHGHLSNDDAGRAAVELARRGVRLIVLGHLSGENNFPELAYESVCCALRAEGLEPGRDIQLALAGRHGENDLYIVGGTDRRQEVI